MTNFEDVSSLSSGNMLKMLAVEDDRNFCLILQKCLRCIKGFKFEKYFTPDIQSSLKKFREVQPDVMLLDISLPDGNGLAMIKSMLQMNPLTGLLLLPEAS